MEKELNNILKQKVKKIDVRNGHTVIIFEDDSELQLDGQPFELPESVKIPTCNFCGHPASKEEPLFSVDGESFICKDCINLAYKTFISKGFSMPLDIKIEGFGKKNGNK